MKNILFICSGNTCRSPMGEALFRSVASRLGLEFQVMSAGLSAFVGDTASEDVISVMREMGLDIDSHRSRAVSPLLLQQADRIFCVTEAHKRALLPYVEESRLYVPKTPISDPFGCGIEAYRDCAAQLKKEVCKFLLEVCDFKIVPMSAQYISDLAEIEQECFSTPWTEAGLNEELINPHARFFVAVLEDKTAGYIGSHNVAGECYITNVAVSEKYRRLGIGEALVDSLLKAAAAEKWEFVSLEVRESNSSAIALYSSCGFEKVGCRKNFYAKPIENAIIMTRFFNGD